MMAVVSGRANVIYVSSSVGDDNNDGHNKRVPLKTIASALPKGDTILLKSGDVFYENVTIQKGLLSKYGGKKLPVLCGYKQIVTPKWQRVNDSIWKISLSENNFCGFDTRGSSQQNNIGCIYEYDKDILHGRRAQFKKDLKEDWDFWQTEHYKKDDVSSVNFDSLYMRYSGNPNLLHLSFSVGETAVRIFNSTIDGVRIEGFGFGISSGSNVTIRNCDIDAIGGMMQIGYDYFVCLGNGIEFWVGERKENCLVENCNITRCYDCAVTIQGSRTEKGVPKNIIVRNNFIADCCQAWEDFLNNDVMSEYQQCFFSDNIVVNSGKTAGFNYPSYRTKYCHVLTNNLKRRRGMNICNNLFVGGNLFCSGEYDGKYMSNNWTGNTCIIKRGDWILRNATFNKDIIKIPIDRNNFAFLDEATDDAIRKYREETGDLTTKFIVKDDKAINRQIAKLKRKYLRKRR